MMISQRQRRTREHTGPSPHSVAIVARAPNKRPPEQLILERRKKEEARENALQTTKYNDFCDLKNDWERWTDRKIQLNTVKRRVSGLLQNSQFEVESRREKLRELLAREELEYLEEMEAKEETVLERQAKMRERAKELREKREADRLKIVQEKYDQKWRNECEELRSTMSKRQQDQVCVERMEQLRIKSDMEYAKQEEEKMFADLWYQDMMNKAAREERDTQAAHERNKDMLTVLQVQKAAFEAQRAEAQRLKEEEGILLKEQEALRRFEEQQALAEKRRVQEETRNVYDRSIRLKLKKQAREIQEELAFDMKILEQLLEESRNEALEQAQRKKELREEDQRYRENLFQMIEEEKQREAELDSFLDSEVEKMWQKRLNQWRLEKEARKQLLADVLSTRNQQVLEKLRLNEQKQMESQRERDEILRAIEENKRSEMEKQERIRNENLKYQSDLEGQIDYMQRQSEIEKMEAEREYMKEQQAEMEYQTHLKEALDKDINDKEHPYRRKALLISSNRRN